MSRLQVYVPTVWWGASLSVLFGLDTESPHNIRGDVPEATGATGPHADHRSAPRAHVPPHLCKSTSPKRQSDYLAAPQIQPEL